MKGFLKKHLKIGPILWVLAAGVFLYLNQTKFLSDSELWPVTASRYFFSGKNEYFFWVKPGFHFLLWFNQWVADLLGVHPIFLARLWAGINAIVIGALCDQLLKRNAKGLSVRVLFQLLLWSCSFWTFRSGEVRSDLLVTTVFLLALPLRSERSLKAWVILWVLIILSVLISVKALFLWLAASPLFFPLASENLKNHKVQLGMALAAVVGLIGLFPQFKNSYEFLISSLDPWQTGMASSDFNRMEHVYRFVVQNPQVMLVILGFVVWCAFQTQRRAESTTALLILALVLLFPDPLPFFIASLLPLVLLFIGLSVPMREEISLPWSGGVGILLLGLMIFRAVELEGHVNFSQRSVMDWMRDHLKDRSILVYDPGGLLPADNTEYWFVGPGMERYLKDTFQRILDRKVDVIFATQKFQYFEEHFQGELAMNYVRYGKSFYVRALDFSQFTWMPSCGDRLNRIREHFPLQVASGAPLYVREFDDVNDRSYRVDRLDQALCDFKVDSSNPKVRTVLMPFLLENVPREDLNVLFHYDSYF